MNNEIQLIINKLKTLNVNILYTNIYFKNNNTHMLESTCHFEFCDKNEHLNYIIDNIYLQIMK